MDEHMPLPTPITPPPPPPCLACAAAPLPTGALLCDGCREPETDDPNAPPPGPPTDGRRLVFTHRTTAGAWLARPCRGCSDATAFWLWCQACRQWGA